MDEELQHLHPEFQKVLLALWRTAGELARKELLLAMLKERLRRRQEQSQRPT